MNVAIVRGGGVAGFVRRTQLDAGALATDDAAALAAHVQRAGLLTAQPAPAPAPAHADEMSYEVTVDHDGEEHTATYSQTTLPEPVRELIAWVDAQPASEDSVSPPGAA